MTTPHVCITGIGGFAGSHLAEHLIAHGYQVSGTLLPGEQTVNIEPIKAKLSLHELDITDATQCRTLLAELQPTHIAHLAAQASVGASVRLERLTYDVNITGSLNMMEAARALERLQAFLIVSSSDCYGMNALDGPLSETTSFDPQSPYAISKVTAEQIGRLHARLHHLPLLIARSFNHAGPRQSELFVISDFARQIALIEAGQQEPLLRVGNLEAERDFSDVRDIVTGYRLLLERGTIGQAYNFCTGTTQTVQGILDRLLSYSDSEIVVEVDKSKYRKNDIPTVVGDGSKAKQELGYLPQYNIEATVRDTLAYWRSRINR
jgi:GDP-4-dehydro-6-deoxy-D-mannose reductase